MQEIDVEGKFAVHSKYHIKPREGVCNCGLDVFEEGRGNMTLACMSWCEQLRR
jgi:hypothetical protein